MSRVVKDMVIADLYRRIGDARDFVVVNAAAVDAFATNNMRNKLRARGMSMLTVKNALAKKALSEVGLGGLKDSLEGPSALVWGGQDIVDLSKEITKWVKTLPKLVVKGGLVDGASVTAEQVVGISKGPTREELISRLVGQILGPGAGLAAALLGPGGTVAGQVKSIADKEPEAAAEEPAAAV